MKDYDHNTELLLRYLDGTLTGEETAQVEEMLAQNTDARAILRSIAEQAVAIADDSRVKAARNSTSQRNSAQDEFTKIEKEKNKVLRALLVVAAVVIVALSVGLIYQLAQSESPTTDENLAKQDQVSDPSIAKIIGGSGALIWTGDRGQIVRDITVGTELAGGTIEGLAPDSWFQLQFRDGSTVTISGASLLTFADLGQKELRLREGRLSAKVEPQPAGKPMLIHTRSALLKVLGTQFDVEADLASTVLTVSEGKVNFKRLSDGSEVDVLAKHHVTTDSDTDADLAPTLTPDSVHEWKSQLDRKPENYGKWQPATGQSPARVKAIPLVPPHAPQITLHLAGLSVNRADRSPVVLLPNSRFVLRGRLRTDAKVYFGIRVNHPSGEFAGMFRGDLLLKQPLATRDEHGRFEEVYDLPNFTIDPAVRDRQDELAPKPDGLILGGVWAFTHSGNPSGLEITEVELVAPGVRQD